MPSGSKKRKAAKKKKELGANNINTSQGNEDVKSQGSDNGDVDSPASQDHSSHENPFSKENKEIQESSTSIAGVLGIEESTQKAELENSGVIESQRDRQFEDASERKNGCIQNEPVKGSYGDNRDSSSSSSDDEGRMKKPEVLGGETIDSSVAAATVVYSVTPEVSASEEVISVAESASVENTVIPEVIALEKLESALPTSDRVTFVPVEVAMESVKGSSGALEPVTDKYEQKISPSLDAGVSETSNFAAHIKDSESYEHFKSESEDQPLIASRPPVAQRTSWLSCCGLCDVLTGSNR